MGEAKPAGGFHVMLIELTRDLKLQFAQAGALALLLLASGEGRLAAGPPHALLL